MVDDSIMDRLIPQITSLMFTMVTVAIVGNLANYMYLREHLTSLSLDETEVSSSSYEYETVKQFHVIKKEGGTEWKKLHVVLELKHSTGEASAYAAIYLDGEQKLEFNTRSGVYEVLSGDIDVANVGFGSHLLELKLKAESGVAYNRTFEVYGVV